MICRVFGLATFLVLLVGCGSGSTSNPSSGIAAAWQSGVFQPSSSFQSFCANPRSGNDAAGRAVPDVQGTTLDENNWLRSWSNELYLWYDEIVDRDPDLFTTPEYFDLLVTNELTPSGNLKDRFHFTFPTDEWIELSQSGVSAGYGMEFSIISNSPPRKIVIAFTQANTPAGLANISRGAEILQIDGVDVVNGSTQADVDTLNGGLFPDNAGEDHTFVIQDFGSTTTRTVALTSAVINADPVQNVSVINTATGPVGYMSFHDHIATAESELINAINQLQLATITDLVLDLRYNGGGFLDIASELGFMIAGAANASGETFELLQFNDKHPDTNPVTGNPITPILFHEATRGFSVTSGQALPSLNLNRVFVLTGPNTCSASESIMNGLRGVDVEVIQIGSTTCGKPFGFYATDNCGTTYFTIQFQGVNAKGFGDYPDGFSPENTTVSEGVSIPGCSVADDFSKSLGDPTEARLAAALQYRETLTCPTPDGARLSSEKNQNTIDLSNVDGIIPKSIWHQNRILER